MRSRASACFGCGTLGGNAAGGQEGPRLGASSKGRPLICPVRGGYRRQPSGRIAPLAPVQRGASLTQGSPRMIPSGSDDNGLLDRLDHAR
jgi:hypothetical protein